MTGSRSVRLGFGLGAAVPALLAGASAGLLTPRSGTAALADVPLTPDREQARQWAAQELSGREYAQARPGILQRAMTWIGDHLTRIHVPNGPGSLAGVAILVLVVVAVVLLVVWRTRPFGPQRRPGTTAGVLAESHLSAEAHRLAVPTQERQRLGPGRARALPGDRPGIGGTSGPRPGPGPDGGRIGARGGSLAPHAVRRAGTGRRALRRHPVRRTLGEPGVVRGPVPG